MINLRTKEALLRKVMTDNFDYLTTLPKKRRQDKERTGVAVRIEIPLKSKTLLFPVYDPSQRAMYLVQEKLLRTMTKGHATSQNSEDPETVPMEMRKKFRGCITIQMDGYIIYISISGLLGSEDVACAIILGGDLTGLSATEIIKNIQQRGGLLPDELFQKGHYLCELLKSYDKNKK